ncbi:MAG: hypothetical protein LBH44_11530 [Treponema sp.]|nr:hypothetical protein [Treponema sp.]
MKIIYQTLSCLLLTAAALFTACGREENSLLQAALSQTSLSAAEKTWAAKPSRAAVDEAAGIRNSLDELAELERAGNWFQGMALAESGMREKAGDYTGAVAAAYKELAWAYGRGLIQKTDVEQGLLNLLSQNNDDSVVFAADAVLAFTREQWDAAATGLGALFDELEEPDGFGRWMVLSCALEKNRENRQAAAAYKAIRARYVNFPEYWYRGARAFPGIIAAEYAENCINAAPQGPFASECRNILAAYNGLKREDGFSIKTKTEIELIISESVNAGNPQLLDVLLPLISLPDNPYTVYAMGALRALTSVPGYRDYFDGQARVSKGRLAERLSYICRG